MSGAPDFATSVFYNAKLLQKCVLHIHAYQLCRISLVNVFRTATTYVYKLEQDKNRPAKLELIFLGEEDV